MNYKKTPYTEFITSIKMDKNKINNKIIIDTQQKKKNSILKMTVTQMQLLNNT